SSDKSYEAQLEEYDGLLVPGGFGKRGIEGMLRAIQYAREKGVPYFGICLGMQTACIEYARNVCGIVTSSTASMKSRWWPPGCAFPVLLQTALMWRSWRFRGTRFLLDASFIRSSNRSRWSRIHCLRRLWALRTNTGRKRKCRRMRRRWRCSCGRKKWDRDIESLNH